jgi:hypothetical protein
MIGTVRECISADRRMTLWMMEEKLEISRETILKILVEDLGKRKICARFVPYCLTEKQKALRLQTSQEFIQYLYDDRSLLDSIVTGDETCCFQYDSQTKGKTWNAARQALQDTKHFDFKSQKQNYVSHILRQFANHSERICSTRSEDE